MSRAILASWVACFAFYACASPEDASSRGTAAIARRVYVSLTSKGTVTRFYNRLADMDSQLVTTPRPVLNATAAAVIDVSAGERLYVVEAGGFAALPADAVRLGHFAVIRVPDGVAAESVLGSPKAYAEVVPNELTDASGGSSDPATSGLAADLGDLTAAGALITIDRAFLETKLSEFSGATPATIGGRAVTIAERRSATGRTNARAWLRQEYEKLGFTVTEQAYGRAGGVNFIAEKQGADTSRYFVLSSHLDNVGNAGADDDGSGTISVLAIAQAVGALPLRYNLRIVAFDQEESGLLGSAAYAKSLNDASQWSGYLGDLTVEMTGYDSDGDGAFHAIDCSENTSASLSAVITDVLARDSLPLKRVDACTNRSDHASFWKYDKPAIVVSQNFFGGDDDPCYHQSCDKFANINFNYMTQMATALARATASIVLDRR